MVFPFLWGTMDRHSIILQAPNHDSWKGHLSLVDKMTRSTKVQFGGTGYISMLFLQR